MWILLFLVASVGATTPRRHPLDTDPYKPPQCPKNEYFEVCPKECPTEFCSRLWTKQPCTPKYECCPPPACMCKEGFLRDVTTKRCITVAECNSLSPLIPPPSPTCGNNEKPVKCKTVCPPQSCRLAYTSYLCAQPIKCEPGCDCIDGHWRNDSGICIPKEKCPGPVQLPVCGFNEELVECRTECPPQSCDLPYTEYLCAENIPCQPGCDCIKDHFRNSSGICVPSDQCNIPVPLPVCGFNEVPVKCRTECPPQSCDLPYTDYLCAQNIPCQPGCDCIKDYFRNSSGICVPSDQCNIPVPLPVCGFNEVPVKCRTECPPQSCDLPYTDYLCAQNIPCQPGCDCIEGHFRNSSGICVPSEQCDGPVVLEPPITGKCSVNETEVQCQQICPPQSCNISYTDYACNFPIPCTPGCDCKENYLRNASGVCIFNEECPPPPVIEPLECGYNEEEVACFRPCPPRSCDALYLNYLCAFQDGCDRGCQCKDGYLQNSSGICIPSDQCPPPPWTIIEPIPSEPAEPIELCSVNETHVECKQKCPPQSCDISYTSYICEEDQTCESGCDCIDNYLRNSTGQCILNDDCPPPPVVNPLECGYNEEEVDCFRPCPPRSCDALYLNYPCAYKEDCDRGCQCKDGYRTNASGICIPEEQCPPSPLTKPLECGYNEKEVACYRPCPPNSCDAAYVNYLCAYQEGCDRGCDCIEGHSRNASGICIPVEQCPPSPLIKPRPRPLPRPRPIPLPVGPIEICGVNETYVDCKQKCPPQSCEISYTSYFCEPDQLCESGCNCIDNYLRNSTGQCILNDDCPPPPGNEDPPTPPTSPDNPTTPAISCGVNETVGYPCRRLCPPQSCDALYAIHECNVELPCNPGCNCKEDYYRNKANVCVHKSECPPPPWATPSTTITTTPRPNPPSYYYQSSASANSRSSSAYVGSSNSNAQAFSQSADGSKSFSQSNSQASSQYSASASSASSSSVTGIKGYPPANPPAPKPPICRKDENLVNCKAYCPTDYCPVNDSRDQPFCEPRMPCKPGCTCKVGFKRRSLSNDTCIPGEYCPPVTCTRQNEEWSSCPSPCLGETCENAGKPPVICNTLIKDCNPRCVCKKGYYRNANDICVPVSQCPCTTTTSTTTAAPPVKCGPNQSYIPCKTYCPFEFCPINDKKIITPCELPYPCPGGCACNVGFRFKSLNNQTCIRAETCPPVKCTRPNEEWTPCSSVCSSENCPNESEPPFVCNELILNCQPKCSCKKGYYRNRKDICVPKNECPAPTTTTSTTTTTTVAPPAPVPCTRPNEKWNTCPSSCLAEYCRDKDTPKHVCLEKQRYCRPKCVCQKGYYRNDSMICVPAGDCPAPVTITPITEPPVTVSPPVTIEPPITPKPCLECGPNQTEVFCTFKCPNQFCPENDDRVTYACKPPRDCPSGCGCQDGYKYRSNDDLTCVLAKDCPAVECTRPNEEWSPCPSACLAEDCSNANDLPTACPEADCQPKCICKQGYYRNESDICVPKSECFKCGLNEQYRDCNAKCPPDFCPVDDSRAIKDCAVAYPCPGGCGCDFKSRIKSYDNQTCIPAEECPPVKCTRPNEVWNPCQSSCLTESCQEVDGPLYPCNELIRNCQPKCVCAKGYLRNDDDICVPIEECKKCKANQRYVGCKAGCPTDYCPSDDSRGIVACDPPYPCPGGCICKLNYLKLSYNNETCVPVKECPPVKCTRPNEEFDTCPSNCLAELCQDLERPPPDCSQRTPYCLPKCVCKKGYYRNESEICVPQEDCKKCPVNERYIDCKGYCETDYCPTGYPVYPCNDPSSYCTGGCVCDPGYKRTNYYNTTCIPSQDCPLPPVIKNPPIVEPGPLEPQPVPLTPIDENPQPVQPTPPLTPKSTV